MKSIQGVTQVINQAIIVSFPKDFPREVNLLKPKSLLPIIIKTTIDRKPIRIKVINYVIKIKWLIYKEYLLSQELR